MIIFLSSKAERQLKKTPGKMSDYLLSRIKYLSDNPYSSGCKKLINREGWRLRVGDYRILYTVDNKKKELTILSLGLRKEIYKH